MIRKYAYMLGIALVCMQASAMEKQQRVSPEKETSTRKLINNFNRKVTKEGSVKENKEQKPEELVTQSPQEKIRKLIKETHQSLKKELNNHIAQAKSQNTDPKIAKKYFLDGLEIATTHKKGSVKEIFCDCYTAIAKELSSPEISALEDSEEYNRSSDLKNAESDWKTIISKIECNDSCCVIL